MESRSILNKTISVYDKRTTTIEEVENHGLKFNVFFTEPVETETPAGNKITTYEAGAPAGTFNLLKFIGNTPILTDFKIGAFDYEEAIEGLEDAFYSEWNGWTLNTRKNFIFDEIGTPFIFEVDPESIETFKNYMLYKYDHEELTPICREVQEWINFYSIGLTPADDIDQLEEYTHVEMFKIISGAQVRESDKYYSLDECLNLIGFNTAEALEEVRAYIEGADGTDILENIEDMQEFNFKVIEILGGA